MPDEVFVIVILRDGVAGSIEPAAFEINIFQNTGFGFYLKCNAKIAAQAPDPGGWFQLPRISASAVSIRS